MKLSSGKAIHFWTISHDDMGAVLGGVESFSRTGRLLFRGIADEYCTLNHYSFVIIWLILWFKVFWRILVIGISIPKCVVFIWGITAQNFLKVTSHYWIRPSQLSCLRMNTRFTLIVSLTDNIYWKILRFCSLSHFSLKLAYCDFHHLSRMEFRPDLVHIVPTYLLLMWSAQMDLQCSL